jgi:predicted short-subunit dehydrogenase-like oxidoreductase (DUF2520 family)
MMRPPLGVVGAGRVGAVLAARFRAAGFPLVGVSGRSAASRLRADTLLPGVPVLSPVEVAAASDILVLAVPDDDLIAVAEELAASGAVRPGQLVVHTSGRHGLDALAALTRLGARPIALHPAMTFTGTPVDLERSPVFGLTAGDVDRGVAEDLVAALGGSPMWVAEADRALYHAALAHGANHLVTLVSEAMDLLAAAGSDDPAGTLRPLLEAALDNALAHGDAALTGPIVRGDVQTVAAHLHDIEANRPDTLPSYVTMARATLGRAVTDGRVLPIRAARILALLDGAVARTRHRAEH